MFICTSSISAPAKSTVAGTISKSWTTVFLITSVIVEEPSIADCYNMLLGIKEYYENYHKVSISDNLVYKAVTLSERYKVFGKTAIQKNIIKSNLPILYKK